jgi:hypothetical protein
MQKVITTFLPISTSGSVGSETFHMHNDIDEYIKMDGSIKGEYTIKEIHTTAIPPSTLAITYVIEVKEKPKATTRSTAI